MANQNAPHGFTPIGTMHGGAYRIEQMARVSTNSHAIFKGDLVTRITQSDYTNPEGMIVGVIDGALGFTPGTTLISGVAMNYSPASVNADHPVLTDPALLLEGQSTNGTSAQGGGAGINALDPGMNINSSTAVGGTVYGTASGKQGVSGMQIDPTTIATTSSLDFHMLNLLYVSEALGGNAFGAYARIVLAINKPRMGPVTAGV